MLRFFFVLQLAFCQLLSAYTAEEISEKLYAVHGTNVLPLAGQIRAGLRQKPFTDPLALNLYPDLRDTVHFALGSLVCPIKTKEGAVYSWEDVRYAIVTPLKSLLPQLININCYDTFTLGSVQCDPCRFTLICPKDEVLAQSFVSIYRYDPTVKKVRQAVEDFFKEKSCLCTSMTHDHTEDQLSHAFCEEKNINCSEFFAPLKKEYPYISIVGLRWDQHEGEGYLFGQIELKTFPIVKYLLSGTFELVKGQTAPLFTTEELEKALIEIKATACKVDSYVCNAPFGSLVKLEYDDKRFALQTWINIIEAEIELNKKHNKTLRGASRCIWNEIDSLRSHPEDLRAYLNTQLENLPVLELIAA